MTKIVGSPITRGQANEGMNQIENAMKKCGVDPQQIMKKMLNKKALENMIVEWLKTSQDVNVVSEKFEPSNIVVNTVPTDKMYNIKRDGKLLVATKKEGGLYDFVDSCIIKKFAQVNFINDKVISGKVWYFKKIVGNNDFEEFETRKYKLGHALLLANELVNVGALGELGSCIIICLKEYEGLACGLTVGRTRQNELRLDFLSMVMNQGWDAGKGILTKRFNRFSK